MKKVIIPLIVIVIFIVLVVVGVKSLPKKEVQPPAGSETEEPGVSPETRPGEEPVTGPAEGPAEGPIETEPELAPWQNPEEPMQSVPIKESEIPKEALKLSMTAEAITPATFEKNAGSVVMLAITSKDEWTHIFKFKEKALAKVAVGVGPGQTRVITFYAPNQKGEYEFFCDVPGHEARGEKGKMIVK